MNCPRPCSFLHPRVRLLRSRAQCWDNIRSCTACQKLISSALKPWSSGGRLLLKRPSRWLAGFYAPSANYTSARKTTGPCRWARQWLRHRSEVSTDFIFKTLADRVFPLVLVDKSPSTTSSLNALQRTHRKFPNARYIHLLRHPRGHGESVIRLLEERRKSGPIPSTHWLVQISSQSPGQASTSRPEDLVLDPQFGWHARNRTICDFLAKIPAEQRMRVRGEDLLAEPDRILPEIASWMRLLNDVSAIDAMKHPERSPYAFLGPRGARWGNDPFFLQDPLLRPGRVRTHHLEGSLGWRSDGQGFSDEVLALAQEFGYS